MFLMEETSVGTGNLVRVWACSACELGWLPAHSPPAAPYGLSWKPERPLGTGPSPQGLNDVSVGSARWFVLRLLSKKAYDTRNRSDGITNRIEPSPSPEPRTSQITIEVSKMHAGR
ncbi:hypothetical protein ONZ45_g14886 [Pleurotus djamor]|nr:hypothetical protein ONZ45_g14886 [Pleurotus djamor]